MCASLQKMLEDGRYQSARDLAAANDISPSYVARVPRLSLLAPDIGRRSWIGCSPWGWIGRPARGACSLSSEHYGKAGQRRARPYGEKVLSIENLSMGSIVRNTSFSIYSGQVTGLSGLVGAGRTETMKIVACSSNATSSTAAPSA